MSTTPRRLALLAGGVALCAAAFAFRDRRAGADEEGPAAPAAPAAPEPPPGAPSAAEADPYTPRTTDVLLMFSGREHGLMKPCGCSSPQRGGLGRRAAMWERARTKAKAYAALSTGGTLGLEAPVQNNMKAELHRSALSMMGYAGVLLSADDLSPFTSSVWQPYGSAEETPRPPLNVKLRATGPLAACASVDPILRFQVGDVPVRAVSVVDPTAQGMLQNDWGVADIVVPADAAIKALTKEPGILVVASHVMREDVAILVGAAAGKADAVVVVDVLGQVANRTPVRGHAFGRPILVTFDEKGKEVVLVTLDRTAAGWIAGSDTVPLDPVYEGGVSKGRDQVAGLFDDYKKRVRAEGLLEAYGSFDDHGSSYVGAEACKRCHAAIYESWSTTKHAHAMKTLVDGNSDADPECVRCHSIGWSPALPYWMRTKSGFQTLEKTPERANVQCESCHGPCLRAREVARPERPVPAATRGGRRCREDLARPRGRRLQGLPRPARTASTSRRRANFENVYLPQVDHREVPKELRTVRPK